VIDIDVDKQSPVPVYQQISQSFRELINQGRISEGYRLPPERKLAQTLGVNRTTILNAYRELKEAGLVSGHVGRGTTVLPLRAATGLPASGIQPLRWSQLVRQRTATPWEGLIRDLHALTEASDIIILSMGLPALGLIPTAQMETALAAILAERGPEVFTSGPCEGLFGFRPPSPPDGASGAPATPTDPGDTGSRQAIDLLARVFSNRATPWSWKSRRFGAINVFQQYQAPGERAIP
jgi:DNA-binding transcriptional MocR family regulator